MRGTSLRTLANLAAASGSCMRRYDFVAAYLQGELLEGETVFCFPPPGYEQKGKDGKNQICRILKPVYGMAQAGRRWQRTLPLAEGIRFHSNRLRPECLHTRANHADTERSPR